jgi:tRNA A-37 threonylcarbamoyl transferase component Bud32
MFHSTLQALDLDRYQTLRAGATVLEADNSGDKVFRLADGTIFKLFRRKRLFSSALIYPYARRFVDNIRRLDALGIACPEIIAAYRVARIARDAVHYHPLAGETLRQIVAGKSSLLLCDYAGLARQLGRFVARLHEVGVYFRSLHLGNVVLTPEGELGLIDVADLRFCRPPLRPALRKRNFRHLLRAPHDHDWLVEDDGTAFRAGYLASSTAIAAAQMASIFFKPYFYIVQSGKFLYRSKVRNFMGDIEEYNFSTKQWDTLAAPKRLRVQDRYFGYEPGDSYSFGCPMDIDSIAGRDVPKWIESHALKPTAPQSAT